MNLDLTWGAIKDSNYASFDNFATNQSAMANYFLQSVNMENSTVYIDKVNVSELMRANIEM
jgi:hypothetical protein